MAYALRYRCDVVFLPPGRGVGMDTAEQLGPGLTGGPAQVLTFVDTAHPSSATFLAADITAMLTVMATDLSTQMNTAATLARVQNFATGGG